MKAFPLPQVYVSSEGKIIGLASQTEGMDLRDYFAAKAMPLAFKIWENYHSSEENDATYKTSNFQADGQYVDLIAETAYQLANAMMKARK
jgi:hypothetical protein